MARTCADRSAGSRPTWWCGVRLRGGTTSRRRSCTPPTGSTPPRGGSPARRRAAFRSPDRTGSSGVAPTRRCGRPTGRCSRRRIGRCARWSSRLSSGDLDRRLGSGTVQYLVSGIIAHDLYHAGQIQMIKTLARGAAGETQGGADQVEQGFSPARQPRGPCDEHRRVEPAERRGLLSSRPRSPRKRVRTMAKPQPEILRVGAREVAISNPDKVLFPAAGHTKLDLVRYYLAVADGALRGAGGRPNVLVRYPNGIGGEFFYQKRAPESRPAWIEVVALRFPSGPHRGGGRAARRRGARLDGQPRLPRAASASGARRRSRSSRRAARRSRSGAGRRVAAGARGRRASSARRSTTSASSAGRRRRARAACTSYVRIERRWTFDRGAARGARARARGRAARAGARHEQVVEGRAARRLPRLQPEREGPHGRRRRTRCGRRPMRACRRRSRGTRSTSASRPTSRSRRCRRASRRSAIGMPASTSMPARSRRCSSSRRGTSAKGWATRRGRRTTGSRRASRRACSRRSGAVSKHPLIEIGRARKKEDALAGLERWKARHPEAAAHLEPADVLVDAMRGRFTTWTRIRVNLQHVPAELRPAQEPLDPDDATSRWTAAGRVSA